jgi:hypothetical protein
MGWTKWQSRRKTEAASKELLRGWTKRILSELLIFRLKHHYPQTKKVITWTGPRLLDVSLRYLRS